MNFGANYTNTYNPDENRAKILIYKNFQILYISSRAKLDTVRHRHHGGLDWHRRHRVLLLADPDCGHLGRAQDGRSQDGHRGADGRGMVLQYNIY